MQFPLRTEKKVRALMDHTALKYLARGALKRPLRRTLRKRLHVVDVALDGIKLRCHMGDNFTENAIVEGRSAHDMAIIARITNDVTAMYSWTWAPTADFSACSRRARLVLAVAS